MWEHCSSKRMTTSLTFLNSCLPLFHHPALSSTVNSFLFPESWFSGGGALKSPPRPPSLSLAKDCSHLDGWFLGAKNIFLPYLSHWIFIHQPCFTASHLPWYQSHKTKSLFSPKIKKGFICANPPNCFVRPVFTSLLYSVLTSHSYLCVFFCDSPPSETSIM